jgi:hypothetical protein
MCWNASVSLNTYIFSLFASTFAYYNNATNIHSYIFYQSFIAIQLIEYFIWSKTFSNSLLSKIGLITILLQPLLNIFTIETKKYLIPYLVIAYLIFVIIVYTFIIPINTIKFISTPSKNGHLSWKWLDGWYPYIMIVWFSFLIAVWIINKKYLTILFTSLLLIVSIILYQKYQTIGSMWCWICNIISFIYIFKVFYKEFCTI